MTVPLFGIKYVLENNILIKYFFFIKLKKINTANIKKVQVVTVTDVSLITINIGKMDKEAKESYCQFLMNDNTRIKIDSGYRTKNGITLGKYLISKYKLKNECVEKYKLFRSNTRH